MSYRRPRTELERYAADPTAAELLGEAAWAAGLRTRSERVERARLAYRDHVDTMRTPPAIEIPSVELLDDLSPEELTPVLRSALQTVRVTKGRGPLPPRVHLAFHGEPPVGVPALQDAA